MLTSWPRLKTQIKICLIIQENVYLNPIVILTRKKIICVTRHNKTQHVYSILYENTNLYEFILDYYTWNIKTNMSKDINLFFVLFLCKYLRVAWHIFYLFYVFKTKRFVSDMCKTRIWNTTRINTAYEFSKPYTKKYGVLKWSDSKQVIKKMYKQRQRKKVQM